MAQTDYKGGGVKMDTLDVTREIHKLYPTLNEEHLHSMVCAEAKAEDERLKSQRDRGRDRYRRAVEAARERILDWIDKADEWNVENAADFVATHRIACVWSVLVGQELRHKGAV